MLVEAKGTTRKAPMQKTLDRAAEQLKAVSSIQFNNKVIADYERHIICSAFDSRDMVYYDVDPECENDEVLSFDIDRAVCNYYENILEVIKQAGPGQSDMGYRVQGQEVVAVEDGSIMVGMLRDLYDMISSRTPSNNSVQRASRLYEEVAGVLQKNSINSQIPGNGNESISLGLDGVLVCEKGVLEHG